MLGIELVAGAAVVLSGMAGRCHDGGVPVHVSLEWRAAVVPGTLRSIAEQEVTAIWERLGVRIGWTVAEVQHDAMVIRASVSDDFGHPSPGGLPHLGRIEFFGEEPANVVRVSAVAALHAAEGARTQGQLASGHPLGALRIIAARLIGRAIAHEVGHYLLRSRLHTASGLMRPVFPAYEALTPLLDRYRLDRRHLEALRDGCR